MRQFSCLQIKTSDTNSYSRKCSQYSEVDCLKQKLEDPYYRPIFQLCWKIMNSISLLYFQCTQKSWEETRTNLTLCWLNLWQLVIHKVSIFLQPTNHRNNFKRRQGVIEKQTEKDDWGNEDVREFKTIFTVSSSDSLRKQLDKIVLKLSILEDYRLLLLVLFDKRFGKSVTLNKIFEYWNIIISINKHKITLEIE